MIAAATFKAEPGEAPRLDLQRFVPFRLNRLAAEVSADLARIYGARHGLDVAEWRVLATLAAGEPRTAGFVARSTRTHKTRVSRAVARLEALGLVERAGEGDDRREVPLRRTAAGRALCEELVPLVLARERELLACLGPEERRCFLGALGKLERALGLVAEADPEGG